MIGVMIHSALLLSRAARRTAHGAPGSQEAAAGVRYARLKPKPRNPMVSAIKDGRYGSSDLRLLAHAPPTPSASSRSGPTQQIDAASAVITAPTRLH